MPKKKPVSTTHSITVEYKGVRYTGAYTIESGTVRVSYGSRRVGPTHIGGTAEATARMLFRELLERLESTKPVVSRLMGKLSGALPALLVDPSDGSMIVMARSWGIP